MNETCCVFLSANAGKSVVNVCFFCFTYNAMGVNI